MPSLSQIRDAIVAKLGTVPDIGVVHGFERYAKREADFKALFLSAGKIKGWTVRRVATREEQPAVGRQVVTHGWRLRGYMGLDDATASELAFDATIEAIRDAFRADETLGGLVATTEVDGRFGVQVEDTGPVLFAGVLCHGARLALQTRHFQ